MFADFIKKTKKTACLIALTAAFAGGPVGVALADGDDVFANTPNAMSAHDVLFDDILKQTAENTAAAADVVDVNDPIEPVNRFFFHVMEIMVETMFKPITLAYLEFTPERVQEGVDNFLENLKEPVNIANNLLQGDVQEASNAVGRLLINTTVGIGGINDVTGSLGHDRRREDFGQTLAVWGMGEGPYLFIPLWGPTNPRDFGGQFFVDGYFSPVGLWFSNSHEDYSYALLGANAINSYGEVLYDLEQVKKASVDYYAAIRSLYRQKRRSQISNGADVDLPPLPELTIDFDEEENEPLAGEDAPAKKAPGEQASIR